MTDTMSTPTERPQAPEWDSGRWGFDSGTHIELPAVPPAGETSTRIVASRQMPDGQTAIAEVRDADRLQAYLRCLHRVSHAALATLKPGPLMSQVLEAVVAEFPGARGSVLWRVEGGFRRVARLPRDAGRPPFSRTITEHVVSTRAAVLCEDSHLDERLRGSRSVKLSRARSLLCAPIVIGERVAGMIQLDHAGASHFGRGDLALLNAVTATVSSAVAAVDIRAELVTDRVAQGVRETLRAATIGPGLLQGVRCGAVTAAAAVIGAGELEATVFADAVAITARDGRPGGTIAVLGEVRPGPGMAVGAVRAQTIVHAVATGNGKTASILDTIADSFRSFGIAPGGSAIVLHLDPVAAVIRVAAAGAPGLIVLRAGAAEARSIPVRSNAPILGAPADEAPLGTPFAPGDTLVALSGAVITAGGGDVLAALGHAVGASANQTVGELARVLVAQACLHLEPDVRGGVLVLRFA